MRKKTTLKDIALDAGVSVSTVSRALARNGKISSEKEKRIYESAQRLNYPLQLTSTPYDLRINVNIALVTYFYLGEFFSALFDGFDKACRDSNANIRLLSVANSKDSHIDVISGLTESGFDAAVIFLPDFDANDYRNLLNAVPDSFPLVSAAPIVSPVLDTVTFDHYRGGHSVAAHFEEQGFKKLGIILGPTSKSEAMLRKNGFADYIAESKDLDLIWECRGDYSIHAGISAYEKYRDTVNKPEAIFCSNDDIAIGFIYSAIRDGVNIPEDVAIAGFDDLPKCEFYTPAITSVHTPYEVLGKKAINLLLTRLKEEAEPQHNGYTSIVPVSLTVRESSLNSVTEVLP